MKPFLPPQRLTWVVAALLWGSCASASRDHAWVSDELTRRTGHGLRSSGSEDDSGALRPDTMVRDGLDEDEAAALALQANPAFLADMARLRSAEADFEEARRPDNPRLSALGPVGAISAAVSLVAPIASLFQIPRRTEAANRALEAVAESLVQSGLNTARDARLAHIDCVLAGHRLMILEEQRTTAEELAGLAELRAGLGDVSPAEAAVVRSQAALSADALSVGQRDHEIAIATLLTMLDIDPTSSPVDVTSTRDLPSDTPPLRDLISVARLARPDVRAAEMELESAVAQVDVEAARVLSISLQTDLQWTGSTFGARIGGSLELPIFNQNQGGRGRAKAAVEVAFHRLAAARQRVVLEVIRSSAQLRQALESRSRFQTDVLPPLQVALDAATQQYELGETAYLVVLDSAARLASAQLRLLELDADARRAHAELERSIGARIEVAIVQEMNP